MTHPQNLAAMAGSCFQCHVVDDEALVNQVGHPAISDGFEVLSWYSGEVKHNFMVSKGGPVKAHVKEPQVIPPARKRMLFLTGKLSHAAQTLRVLAAATDAPVDQDGTYLRLPNGRILSPCNTPSSSSGSRKKWRKFSNRCSSRNMARRSF